MEKDKAGDLHVIELPNGRLRLVFGVIEDGKKRDQYVLEMDPALALEMGNHLRLMAEAVLAKKSPGAPKN